MILLTALAAACLATAFFSETRLAFEAFEFTAALVPFQRGETVILLPPLGKLRAATHWGPFMLKLTLNTIDPELLSSSVQEIPDLATFLSRQIQEQAAYFCTRLAAYSFLCGAALYFVAWRRKGKPYGRTLLQACFTGLLTLLLLALLLGSTLIYPYQASAFCNPRFEGALASVPWIAELSGQFMDTVNTLTEQAELIAVNIAEISARVEQLHPPPESDEIRVLHVSDIHNNPVALELIEKIAQSFQVDLIIDTGDLTDYGSSLETELATRLAALPQPYLFLPGNHDTPQSIEMMSRAGARIIGEVPLEVSGLQIAGLADPASSNLNAQIAEESVLLKESDRAAKMLKGSTKTPDIIALHNPLMARSLFGKAPLILAGHTHRAAANFDEKSGTILLNAGSTGAAGVRGLLAPRDNPYTMIVLYFGTPSRSEPRLICADLITIEHFPDSFSLQRFYNHLPELPDDEKQG